MLYPFFSPGVRSPLRNGALYTPLWPPQGARGRWAYPRRFVDIRGSVSAAQCADSPGRSICSCRDDAGRGRTTSGIRRSESPGSDFPRFGRKKELEFSTGIGRRVECSFYSSAIRADFTRAREGISSPSYWGLFLCQSYRHHVRHTRPFPAGRRRSFPAGGEDFFIFHHPFLQKQIID